MNIKYYLGNIFTVPLETPVVVPVNTVGVTGGGMAKAWADLDPTAAHVYRKLCRDGLIEIGQVWPLVSSRRWILFPTKREWQNPSHIEYIKQGLTALLREAIGAKYVSIAIPLIGCGLGRLRETDVLPLLYRFSQRLPETTVMIFKQN